MKKYIVFLWILPIIISVMTLSVFAYIQIKDDHISDVSDEIGNSFNGTLYNEKIIYDDLQKLEIQIKEIIEKKRGIWSVYVKNLKTNAYISVNSVPLKPASTIKIFNMAAFYNSLNKGETKLDEKAEKALNSMITASDNNCSNYIVSLLGNGDFKKGAKNITDFAQSIGLKDTIEEHMLYDRSPKRGVSGKNLTTVYDCGVLLEKIYKKTCVNEEYDAKMLDLLLHQTRNNKIPEGLPDNIEIANKTGENNSVQADVGIVFSPVCDYIICIIENNDTEKSGIEGIKEISKLTYDYFNN